MMDEDAPVRAVLSTLGPDGLAELQAMAAGRPTDFYRALVTRPDLRRLTVWLPTLAQPKKYNYGCFALSATLQGLIPHPETARRTLTTGDVTKNGRPRSGLPFPSR